MKTVLILLPLILVAAAPIPSDTTFVCDTYSTASPGNPTVCLHGHYIDPQLVQQEADRWNLSVAAAKAQADQH